MLPLLLFDSAILDLALVDVQQFAEIINLSKLGLTLYLYGFKELSFLQNFCVIDLENDGVLNDCCNYITGR